MPRAITRSVETDTGHARDYVAVALEYALGVVGDKRGQKHGKLERQAAKRFLDDIKRSPRRDSLFYFDAWHGNDVCDFIEKLPHVKGTFSTSTITLEPVQCFILVNIFSFRLKLNDRRRFTSVYIEMARKNAKSTLTAGVALYCSTCEGENGPDVVIGATTRQQADKVFLPIKQMVQKTSDLREAFNLKAWANEIKCGFNSGTIQPINSKSETQDGWNPYMAVLDELHAHKNRGLYDVLQTAFGARDQPMMWMITTAGYNILGVCYEQRSLTEKILAGSVKADHYYGIIFTLDEGDDPLDEKNWIKANPLIGVSVKWAVMRAEAIQAKASPAQLGDFKTKRLNIWLNAASAWLSVERWKKCLIALNWDDFLGLECTIGADLADKDDVTALVLLAEDDNGRLLVKPLFFLPAAALIRETQSDTGQSTYGVWAGHNGGPPLDDDDLVGLPPLFDENKVALAELPEAWRNWLLVTPGDFVDHNQVETFIRWLVAKFSVRRIVFDQFAAAQAMASRLNEDLGTPDDPLATILHKSAANVTDPAKDIEARLKAGAHQIAHDGNPVMTWMIGNAVVTRHVNGTIIPKKETGDSPNKIDGVDAMINANAPRMLPQTEEASTSWAHVQ